MFVFSTVCELRMTYWIKRLLS